MTIGIGFQSRASFPGDYLYDFSVGVFAGATPVTAGWSIPWQGKSKVAFFRYDGTGYLHDLTNWIGPTVVGLGVDTRLSSGPSGLFLSILAYRPGKGYPDELQVRRFDGMSFGSPVIVGGPEVEYESDLFQDTAVRTYAVWRRNGGPDGPDVLRLAVSNDGGTSFMGPSDLTCEDDIFHIRGAAAPDGQGLVVWDHNYSTGEVRAVSTDGSINCATSPIGPTTTSTSIPTVLTTTTTLQGSSCDLADCDGDLCTVGDTCIGAACRPGAPITAGWLSELLGDDTTIAAACAGDRGKTVHKVVAPLVEVAHLVRRAASATSERKQQRRLLGARRAIGRATMKLRRVGGQLSAACGTSLDGAIAGTGARLSCLP